MEDQELRQILRGIAGRNLEERTHWYSPAAAAYDATRPKYPPELVDEVIQSAGLTGSSRILEIGCGPGTATTAFAQLGCRMVCLEPNPEFYALALSNCRLFPGVRVCNTTFEGWDLEVEAFDAVLAASSMHWIPSRLGYDKASRALRDGGRMILLWNKELQPCGAMRDALSCVYGRHAPSLGHGEDAITQEAILAGLGGMMLESGRFGTLLTASLQTSVDYTADQYISLLGTYSSYLQLERSTRNALFADIRQCILAQGAGEIRLSYRSAYHVARKLPAAGTSALAL
jgi:SAM-dependent methyltransferase